MKKVIASTMIALATLSAVPAKAADTNDVIAGVIFGAILANAANNNRHVQGDVIIRDRAVEHIYGTDRGYRDQRYSRSHRQHGNDWGYSNPRVVCYQESVRTDRRHAVRVERNCYGDVLGTRYIHRGH